MGIVPYFFGEKEANRPYRFSYMEKRVAIYLGWMTPDYFDENNIIEVVPEIKQQLFNYLYEELPQEPSRLRKHNEGLEVVLRSTEWIEKVGEETTNLIWKKNGKYRDPVAIGQWRSIVESLRDRDNLLGIDDDDVGWCIFQDDDFQPTIIFRSRENVAAERIVEMKLTPTQERRLINLLTMKLENPTYKFREDVIEKWREIVRILSRPI